MRRTLGLVLTSFLIGSSAGCDVVEEEGCPGDPELHAFELSTSTVAPGDTIEATFEVHNFQFSMEGEGHAHDSADHTESTSEACPMGHVHVYLDDLMTNPLAMLTFDTGDIVIPAGTMPGEHRLIARLQNADHTIIEPQIVLEQTITVQ